MNYKYLIQILLFLSVILEPTILAFPAVIIFSILLYFIDASKKTLGMIFIASIFLDILRMQNIGSTSLFLFLVLFVLDVYKKNFDVSDSRMVMLLALASSFIYASFTKYSVNIIFFIAFLVVFFLSLRKSQKNDIGGKDLYFLRR